MRACGIKLFQEYLKRAEIRFLGRITLCRAQKNSRSDIIASKFGVQSETSIVKLKLSMASSIKATMHRHGTLIYSAMIPAPRATLMLALPPMQTMATIRSSFDGFAIQSVTALSKTRLKRPAQKATENSLLFPMNSGSAAWSSLVFSAVYTSAPQ